MSLAAQVQIGDTQVAPGALSLIRVAGLPLTALLETIPPATTARIEALLGQRAVMDRHKSSAIDALYEAIPKLPAPERPEALAFKRAIHGARAEAAREYASLAKLTELRDSEGLSDWIAAARSVAALEAEVVELHDAELASHVLPRLRTLFERESFLKPLVLASPSLFAHARNLPPPGRAPTRRERQAELSLLAYVIRASAKTSPFSSFLYLALLERSETGEAPGSLDWSSTRTQTRLALCAEFALTGGRPARCGKLEHCRFRIDPNTTWTASGAEVFRPFQGNRRGRIIEGTMPARIALPPELSRRLADLECPFSWADLLDAIGSAVPERDHAEELAHAIADSGLIWPVAEDRPTSTEPHEEAAACCAAARENGTRLARMKTAAEALAQSPSWQRAVLLREIASEGGRELGEVLDSGSPIFETAYFDRPIPWDRARLADAITDIRVALANRVSFSPPFLMVRDAFEALYGSGGTCLDVAGFLRRIPALLQERHATDLPLGADGWEAPPPGARAPATVMFQFEAPERKASRLVINVVHSGCGWLSAYHAIGGSSHSRHLAHDLGDWLRRLTAPAPPVEIRAGGRWSDLQLHPPLTKLVIRPPGDLSGGEPAIDWRDLTLRHAPDLGQIEFHQAGQRIGPVYLGGSKPNLSWGPVFWLIALASPFIVRPFLAKPPVSPDDDSVLFQPGEASGRVVLQRASWWIPAGRLRRLWFARRGGLRLVDIRADCVAQGISPRFFARRWTKSRNTRDPFELPKPLWVDVRHPLTVDLLERETAKADFLCLTEALPADPGPGGHAVEFHLEMVLP